MNAKDIEGRTARAVRTAADAARALGLEVTEPRALYVAFSVIVHLAPAPVVARVPTVLPQERSDPADVADQQRRELAVAGWLSDEGHAVVPPSPLVPREPVQCEGFSMTFWQFVSEDPDKVPDYAVNSERVADLHAALRDYPGPLSFLSSAEPDFVTDSLALLGDRPDLLGPADLDRARREWTVLEPLVRSRAAFEQPFPGIDLQPIHGDSPPANIFAGVDGDLFSDFELVTLGPIEWDLAALGPDLEAAYNRGALRNGMRPLDEGVMKFVNAIGMLRVVAYLALAPQLPVLVEVMKPAVDQWRSMPFAGGLAT